MVNILIRCDLRPGIGLGHFYRSFRIAKHIQKLGVSSTFLIDEEDPFVVKLLKEHGFLFLIKNGDEAKVLEDLFHQIQFRGILIDHYELGLDYEISLPKELKVFVIDDLARSHQCDLLIDHNQYVDHVNRYVGKVNKSCIVLSGAKYALLDPVFLDTPSLPKSGNEGKHVLVSYGGEDPTGETLKFSQALVRFFKGLKPRDFSCTIICGPLNKKYNEIKYLFRENNLVEVISHVSNINEYMLKSDLAFGAGGGMIWERGCLGLKTVLTSIASNQTRICEDLGKQGFCYYLGQSSDLSVHDYEKVLYDFSNNQLKIDAESLVSIVDGMGVKRVGECIQKILTLD